MKLLTKDLEIKLLTADYDSMTPIVKFFNPVGCQTWLACSAEKVGDDFILQAYCDLGMGCVEFGSVSLKDLMSVKLPMGLKIERDLHWKADKTKNYTDLLRQQYIIQ